MLKPETAAIHSPHKRRDGAIAPPLHLSTTYEHGPANEHIHGFEYIRDGNPNVNDLEARLAAVEGGCGAVVFASGMGAGAALLNTLPAGSEVLFHRDVYFDFKQLCNKVLPQWGVTAKFADLTDEKTLQAQFSEKTKLVFFESPSNPNLDVIDIAHIAQLAASVGAKVVVDGTFATPALQKPFEHGADYVLHSLTKYIGGHSDVQGGALIVKDDPGMLERLVRIRTLTGGVLAPFNAWLISRGMQTLFCRMERHCANAFIIAKELSGHHSVSRVRYPFLEGDPGHAIAKKQMSAGGGMVSFEVQGGRQAALKVASKVGLFVNATSLGGVESLIEHRASVEGPGGNSSDSLLRLSVGLEHPDDLLRDLMEALAAL